MEDIVCQFERGMDLSGESVECRREGHGSVNRQCGSASDNLSISTTDSAVDFDSTRTTHIQRREVFIRPPISITAFSKKHQFYF